MTNPIQRDPMRWAVCVIPLAGLSVLFDQLAKDAATYSNAAVLVDGGLVTILTVCLLAFIIGAWILRRQISLGMVLISAATVSGCLDLVLYGGWVFPWHMSSIAFSITAFLFAGGVGLSAYELIVKLYGEKPMKPHLTAGRALKNAPRGMTLIEILVVILIIGLVITAIAVAVVAALGDAKEGTASSQLNTVSKGVKSYYLKHGELPDNLEILVEQKRIQKGQLKDPWGKELTYEITDEGEVDGYRLCAVGGDDPICIPEED
jgi:general secretion pathway protein G